MILETKVLEELRAAMSIASLDGIERLLEACEEGNISGISYFGFNDSFVCPIAHLFFDKKVTDIFRLLIQSNAYATVETFAVDICPYETIENDERVLALHKAVCAIYQEMI